MTWVTHRARAALAVLLLAASVAAGPGDAYPPSPLAPPAGGPGPEGTVTRRERRARTDFLLRARGLEGREAHALRLAGGADLGSFSARRRGAGRLRLRGDRLPPGLPLPLDGRAVEVVRLRDGEVVLEGTLPGDPPPPPPSPTRLPGVDGPGPFATASAVLDLPTAPGGLDPNATRVHHPVDGSGAVPEGEFPVVVVLHGFSARAHHYEEWGRHLASWGLVALVSDHADPILPVDHEAQVATALGLAAWAEAADADPASPFHGRLREDAVGFLGHSVGGGTAVVAAARAAAAGRVRAVVAMAPAPLVTGFPPAPLLPDAASPTWPATLVIAGAEDLVIPPEVSRALYFDPAPAPRAYLRMDGFFHTGFSEGFLLGDYDPATSVTGEEQKRHTRLYAIPWFLHHLAGDGRVRDYVDGSFAEEDAAVEVGLFE
jgi:dienelactone hydrolase